jgi:hypothetical protein
MRSWLSVIAVIAGVGCHAEIGGGEANNPNVDDGPDAAVNGSGIDAAVTPDIDAAPACASGRAVFLNFDGQALTDAPSDATQNRASWIVNGTINPAAPASNRSATNKQAIVDGVKAQLASFPIAVVTTRPAQGPYVMVVFGGTAANVGSRFGVAVQELDCGDLRKSDVAWISDSVTPTQRVVNSAIGALGFGLGLTATLTPTDCMCGWDNACTADNSVACTLSPMIDRDPNANQRCPGLTTQNEVAAFQTFCQ